MFLAGFLAGQLSYPSPAPAFPSPGPSPLLLPPAGHNYIGTEHILLGLLREGEGVASRVLETLGADPQKIRTQVGGWVGGWVLPIAVVGDFTVLFWVV